MLHFASAEECGIGCVERAQDAISEAQFNATAEGCRNPFQTVQTPLQRITRFRLVYGRRVAFRAVYFSVNNIPAAWAAHGVADILLVFDILAVLAEF
jgi:hypothetical protein